MLAGLLEMLMSSLSVLLNSSASLLTGDIYQKLFPSTSFQRLVRLVPLERAAPECFV